MLTANRLGGRVVVRWVLESIDSAKIPSHYINRDWLYYRERRKNGQWGAQRCATRIALARWASGVSK